MTGKGLINELPDSIMNQLYNLYRVQLPLFQLLYTQQQENITNFRNNTLLLTNQSLYQNENSQIPPDVTILAKEIQ